MGSYDEYIEEDEQTYQQGIYGILQFTFFR